MRVALVFGGRSVEHEVSVTSARGVRRAMESTALACVPVGVTGDGRWLSPAASTRILDSGASRVESAPAEDDGIRLVLDPGAGGLLEVTAGEAPRRLAIDVVFPLVHGWGGEDGRLQGALDLAGLPFVGAGVAGSAVGMDKVLARRLFAAAGLEIVPGAVVTAGAIERDGDRLVRELLAQPGLPAFVKPANGGSSVGVSRVREARELEPALRQALRHDRKAIVEQAVDAREIECAVLGNDEPEASGLGEIVPSREFYDYQAKYVDGTSELRIPAELPGPAQARVREMAVAAFRALDLAGFARVDFLVRRSDGRVFVNEVNTLPGFTPISMFPKLWEAAGVGYPALIERLVELALERHAAVRRLATRL